MPTVYDPPVLQFDGYENPENRLLNTLSDSDVTIVGGRSGPIFIFAFIIDNAEGFNASSCGQGILRVDDAKAAAGGVKTGCAKPLPDAGAYGNLMRPSG